MKVGANIRKIRILKGYSQEYVADSLQISQKTYSHLENDKAKISLTRLSEIAQFFEVNLFQILTISNDTDQEVLGDPLNTIETRLYWAITNFNHQMESLREEIKLLREQ